jgi:hypothetical protein
MSIPIDQLDPITRRLISRGVTTRSRKRASRNAHRAANMKPPSTGPPSAEPLRDRNEERSA